MTDSSGRPGAAAGPDPTPPTDPAPSADPTPAPHRPPLRRRTLVRGALAVVVLAVLTLAGSVGWIRTRATGHMYTVDTVPAAPVALVLGAQVDPSGAPSRFLAARLALAQRLYATGKVRAVLVTGDFGRPTYDEPDVMRAWLVGHGVPAGRVVADYAGFDTYDSCVRARRVFGVRRAIVVTQSFHLPRAVALCRQVGVRADGVGDDSVRDLRWLWFRATVREQGACVKAAWDVLSGRAPVYLGPHESGLDRVLRG